MSRPCFLLSKHGDDRRQECGADKHDEFKNDVSHQSTTLAHCAMPDDRMNSLEVRVAVVENEVSEIKTAMRTIHDDLRENTRVTQRIQDDTKELVKATQGVGFLLLLLAKMSAVAAGVAGIIYLAQQAAKVVHP